MTLPFLDLAAVHSQMRPELDEALRRVLDAGTFVLGEEVFAFEREFAQHVGARHCVAVGNGLDAIVLTLRALGIGPGHEVVVPSHTFVASWLGVSLAGATPVPVEPPAGSYTIDAASVAPAIGPRTRAVLPVHLYGEPVELDGLAELCQERDLRLVEDAAQAHGASFRGRRVGALGTATWSFYPGKNLGALGDGGAVTTDDESLALELKRLRNYGSETRYVHDVVGGNSRLDELQAAVLRVKLRHLEAHNAQRRWVAERYLAALRGSALVLPEPAAGRTSAWHLFVVRTPEREDLRRALAARGIATQVHYPVPVHAQGAYRSEADAGPELPLASEYAASVVSLPMGPTMSGADVDRVAAAVLDWDRRRH